MPAMPHTVAASYHAALTAPATGYTLDAMEVLLARSLLLAAFVWLAATPRPAAADYPSALVLGTGYATGPPQWTPWQNLPNLEDSLWIFGSVADVNAPFDALLPPGAYELTYVFDSYACVWSSLGTDGCSNTAFAFFDLGSLRVYLDTTPDADFTRPATFRDGTLVLLATAHPLQLFMEDHCVTGERFVQRTVMYFVGGAWFAHVSQNGTGFVAGNLGEFRGDIPAGLAALGYVGQSTSVVNILVPNSVEATTWGRVKALYR